MTAATLRHEIENQVYPANTLLPSEHQLATHFNINRLTLRRALNQLESEGIIIRRQGIGTFVAGTEKTEARIEPEENGSRHFVILSCAKVSEYAHLQNIRLQQTFWEQGCFASIIYEDAVSDNPYRFVERLRQINCNGVVINHNDYERLQTWLKFLRNQGFACVVPRAVNGFEECYPGTAEEYGKFTETASLESVNYLAGHGHRRIAFLADSIHELADYSLRLRGYLRGMKLHGLSDQLHAVAAIDSGEWEEALLDLVRNKKCTALMLFNDAEAMLALKILEHQKIRVPEDVSVIGFGSFYRQGIGKLTTIPVPLDQFSLELCNLLKAMAAGKKYTHRTTPYLVQIQKGVTCAPPTIQS